LCRRIPLALFRAFPVLVAGKHDLLCIPTNRSCNYFPLSCTGCFPLRWDLTFLNANPFQRRQHRVLSQHAEKKQTPISTKSICLNGIGHSVIHRIKGEKMNVIISLIIYLVVFGLIWWLVSMLPLPAPVGQIVRVLFIILLIFIVLSVFGIIPGGYLPRINL
jgi:hypothetical protein